MSAVRCSGDRWLAGAALALCLLGGAAVVATYLGRHEAPRNLLFILIDALRSDHLGCYGYSRETSPFIDELAARGVLFEDVTSQASQTKLSVASIFTSMRPSTHRVRKVDHYVRETKERILSSVLSPSFTTLAEAFAGNGFATGAWVSNPHLREFLGFSQGFGEYYYTQSTDGRELIDRFLTWQEKASPRRFFAYLHFMDVHHPYAPPPPFDRAFTARKARVIYNNGLVPDLAPEDLSYAISQYDGEILHLDSLLRSLLGNLEKRGEAGRTLVVVTADHGDEFFEHHGMGHGFTVYQEVLQVPLIIYWPSGLVHRTVKDSVRLIDLYPTLLDIFGMQEPYDLQGRSVRPLIRGDPLPEVPLYSESSNGIRSLRLGREKIIEGFGNNRERARAYALDKDPLELRPLRPGATLGRLKAEISRLAAQDGIRARQFGTVEKAEIDARTLKALQSLGYAQ